jgi:ADP-ribose pyrophosphatase YjhB (NUDIX family)
MKYLADINEVQAHIMRQLFLRGPLRFAQINTESWPSDQLAYHLRQLIKYELVDKSEDNVYGLSVAGRSRAVMFDARTQRFIEQGFVAVRIVLVRQRQGVTEYLMQRRVPVPYKGYLSEPGGKVLFGEDVLAAAKRNMLTETGLTCDLELCGLVHFKDEYQGNIVQDKFFFVVRASNPRGELLSTNPAGTEQFWLTLDQIKADPKTHQGVTDMIALAEAGPFGFLEQTHVVTEY